MITAIINKFGKWLVYLAAGFVLLAGVYTSGRKSVKAKAEKAIADAEREAKTKVAEVENKIDSLRAASEKEAAVMKGAANVQAKINAIDSGDVVNRLRSDWSRD